ncbi:MAG: sulfatase-like hydrolase/transferase [Planctomycetota bacterium]|jgi:arylsulfatase
MNEPAFASIAAMSMIRRQSMLKACAVAATLVLSGTLWAGETTVRKPNIIFILADDLGYAELGCYGQEKIRTPNIDRPATEGMRFT